MTAGLFASGTSAATGLSSTTHCVALTLFTVALLLQLAGVGLIVKDIRDDLHLAQRITAEPDAPVRGVSVSLPGVTGDIDITGAFPAAVARGLQRSDTFRDFMAQWLAGRSGSRYLGVVVLLLGFAVSFVGSVVALG